MRAFHGGQFWESVHFDFERLKNDRTILRADVLDAWFDPPAGVLTAMDALAARTSPPTSSEGAESAIEHARELPQGSVLLGPGSSALLYLAWTHLLPRGARSFLLEPTYGEYAHLATDVFEGSYETYVLPEADNFVFDSKSWLDTLTALSPDVAVIVNPNNPTGTACDLSSVIDSVPRSSILWVDEAYLDYTALPTMEKIAASRRGIIVLKSLSKVFALSGLRAAYLVAHPETIAALRRFVPPWWVSLPAQVAATKVWNHLPEYAECYKENARLRGRLAEALAGLGYSVVGEAANWVLVAMPGSKSASELQQRLAARGVFVRLAGATAPTLGDRFLRLAVLREPEQDLMIQALAEV